MNDIVLGLIVFLPLITFLIVVHELGHYFTAKLFKVHVHEFGIGFLFPVFKFYTGNTKIFIEQCNTKILNTSQNKIVKIAVDEIDGELVADDVIYSGSNNRRSLNSAILSLFKNTPKTEEFNNHNSKLLIEGKIKSIHDSYLIVASTAWSINLLLLGGFVKLAGENHSIVPRSLKSISRWQQVIIIASGSIINLLLPIIIVFLFLILPHPVQKIGYVVIEHVDTNSYAYNAGFQVGDKIISVNDNQIDSIDDYIYVQEAKTRSSEWIVQRNNQLHPLYTAQISAKQQYGMNLRFNVTDTQYESVNPIKALRMTSSAARKTGDGLSREFSSWASGQSQPELIGPIGMVNMTFNLTQQAGIIGWGIMLIIISINLGIINLLPIPGLDGGRLLFVAIEAIRGGKQLPLRLEGTIHTIVFILLVIFMLFISMNDIKQLIG